MKGRTGVMQQIAAIVDPHKPVLRHRSPFSCEVSAISISSRGLSGGLDLETCPVYSFYELIGTHFFRVVDHSCLSLFPIHVCSFYTVNFLQGALHRRVTQGSSHPVDLKEERLATRDSPVASGRYASSVRHPSRGSQLPFLRVHLSCL
jgi:hypothetical protein